MWKHSLLEKQGKRGRAIMSSRKAPMDTQFAKLVSGIVHSSIWEYAPEVRCVWVAMLATKDKDGFVRGTLQSLSRLANVSVEHTEEALALFLAPDPESRTTDHEGRRIEEVPGGWFVLNHNLYRGSGTTEYWAEAKRKQRAAAAKPAVVPDELAGVAEFEAAWRSFRDYRQRIRASLTPRAEAILLRRLAQRPADAVAALDLAIEKGWRTIEWPWYDRHQAEMREAASSAASGGGGGSRSGKGGSGGSNSESPYNLRLRIEAAEQELQSLPTYREDWTPKQDERAKVLRRLIKELRGRLVDGQG